MKRVFSFFLCLSLIGAAVSCRVSTASDREHLTYLVAGIDDTAGNTDVLLLADYAPAENRVAVLFIPRDTYFASGYAQNKINQLFPSYLLAGEERAEALDRLCGQIGTLFGIVPDGYLSVGISAFRALVDGLGGVPIDLEKPLVFTAGGERVTFPAGKSVLSGADAERFVRHRGSYATGDLGRIEAQKIFLSGLFSAVREKGVLPSFRLLLKERQSISTDLSAATLLSLAARYGIPLGTAQISFSTLPGKAVLSPTGLSYYIADRDASAKIAKDTFGGGDFDPENRLLTPF